MTLKRALLAIVALALLVTAEAFWFHAVRSGGVSDDDDDKPIPAPERVSMIDGQRVIALSNRAQVQNGVVTAHPQSAARAHRDVVSGEVRDTAALSELRARYTRARETAPALAAATQRTIAQRYGPAIATAAARPASAFEAIFNGKQSLIDVALPASGPAPLRLVAEDARGRGVPLARLAPTGRPEHWFYRADANAGLLPGDTVAIMTLTRSRRAGVVVPAGAIVWRRGVPWCYLRRGGGLFTRVSLARATAEPDGGYRSTALTTRDEVVVQGAELLLSEEFRARIQTEG